MKFVKYNAGEALNYEIPCVYCGKLLKDHLKREKFGIIYFDCSKMLEKLKEKEDAKSKT